MTNKTKKKVDAVVIGAGQSGPSLAGRLAGAGQKVVLAERRGVGGTCVNDGCIPTKTLVASARAAWVARNAARWGIAIDGDIRVDMKKVKARKDAVVKASVDGLESWLGSTANLELVKGHARFISESSIQIGDEEIEADRFFINVGARALVPPIPGLKDGPFLTNSSIMDLDVVPEHLVIIGGSYIALEFAQMYRRFGAKVTVIERDGRIIARDDEDVSAEVKRFLEEEGIDIRVGTTVTEIQRQKDRTVVVATATDKKEVRIEGSHLLLAIGRVPNTGDLGLDRAGVERGPSGYIKVDDQLKTNRPNVWAIGDCNGRGAFTHTSYNDYEIVAANLLDGDDSRRVTDRFPIYGLYVDPPLGRVGMTEAEAKKTGKKILVGKRPMTRVGRAFERGETNGFIKVLVDAESSQILGAAILGIEGDEVVHAIADVMYAKAPYTTISRAVHAHPTVSELVPTTFQSLKPLE